MPERPEKYVVLWYYKCNIPNCPNPYGTMDTDRSHADAEWISHLSIEHTTGIIRSRKFRIKPVKEEANG